MKQRSLVAFISSNCNEKYFLLILGVGLQMAGVIRKLIITNRGMLLTYLLFITDFFFYVNNSGKILSQFLNDYVPFCNLVLYESQVQKALSSLFMLL